MNDGEGLDPKETQHAVALYRNRNAQKLRERFAGRHFYVEDLGVKKYRLGYMQSGTPKNFFTPNRLMSPTSLFRLLCEESWPGKRGREVTLQLSSVCVNQDLPPLKYGAILGKSVLEPIKKSEVFDTTALALAILRHDEHIAETQLPQREKELHLFLSDREHILPFWSDVSDSGVFIGVTPALESRQDLKCGFASAVLYVHWHIRTIALEDECAQHFRQFGRED